MFAAKQSQRLDDCSLDAKDWARFPAFTHSSAGRFLTLSCRLPLLCCFVFLAWLNVGRSLKMLFVEGDVSRVVNTCSFAR